MASGCTANYGLSLWEPGDKFLREEFNGDHERADAALRAASAEAEGAAGLARRALEGLEAVSYNVYNLALQNYYEGKVTGWKKALLFDGFLDGADIASKSAELVLRDGRLALSKKGQSDVSLGYSGSRDTALTTRAVSASGCGTLTGFRLKTYLNWSDAASPRLSYDLKVNGVSAASGTKSWSASCAPQTETELTLNFSPGIKLLPGDKVTLSISQTGNMWPVYTAAGGGLGGTFLITPVAAERASMTSIGRILPEAGKLLAWVRCSGGSAALSVVDGLGGTRPMTVGESRETVEPGGARCTETAFTLEEPLPAGNTAFRLDFTAGDSGYMSIYDYGISLQ